ncbi:TBCA [Cordylochernes scorpioides]|uniref:Tubulin-specific chaperone A n=1 Tax=Cordylochernes scorpioides TaxID=51811 RepID=A0ABY6KP23_9ARAC|nr:TBCA [Cordylochernes scorpioides]
MADPKVRQIKIKTGIVKRLVKEKQMYEKDVELQKEKIAKLKSEPNSDAYLIRKQDEVLEESRQMIPDTRKRLYLALNDLRNILDSENDLSEIEEYITAQNIVKDAEAALEA